jgi:hypothetical protein
MSSPLLPCFSFRELICSKVLLPFGEFRILFFKVFSRVAVSLAELLVATSCRYDYPVLGGATMKLG